ncbi:MAG: hypothetical protein Q9227_004734 [Pyrenula ochraceoflavens]
MADTDQQRKIATFCDLTGAPPDEVCETETETHQLSILFQSCLKGASQLKSHQAQQYLVPHGWNVESAVTEFFTAQEEAENQPSHTNQGTGGTLDGTRDDDEFRPENEEDYIPEREPFAAGSQGRRLGDEGDPVLEPRPSRQPQPKSSTNKAQGQKKFATLGDFSSGSQPHESDDEDDDKKQDLFAGGEKSGLAVQNPDDIKKKILERARR